MPHGGVLHWQTTKTPFSDDTPMFSPWVSHQPSPAWAQTKPCHDRWLYDDMDTVATWKDPKRDDLDRFHLPHIFWLVVWNHGILLFHILGIIIPNDFHIFQRGRSTTNQSLLNWSFTTCFFVFLGKLLEKAHLLQEKNTCSINEPPWNPNISGKKTPFRVAVPACRSRVPTSTPTVPSQRPP